VRFYRGISVPATVADSVVDRIRETGIGWDTRLYRVADLRPRLNELWSSPRLSRSDTRSDDKMLDWVCASRLRLDALFYACRHNRTKENDAPILICFDADEAEVVVDGRDFLYPVFQFGIPEMVRPWLMKVFGEQIARYSERAWSGADDAIAVADLAVQDPQVLAAHSQNSAILRGKYGVVFSSSFMVKFPVAPRRIISVDRIDVDEYRQRDHEVDVYSILNPTPRIGI
jgi:hypothetical protein